MAFPTLTAQNPTADGSTGGAATSGSTAATSHSVVLPATVNAGDLLMIFGRVAAAGTVAVSGGGWSIGQDSSDASDDVTFWGYRDTLADGSEDGTSITVTHGSAKMAATTMAIGGAADPADLPPQGSTVAVGTTTTVNPTAATPTGGTKDYFWIWFGGWDGEQTLSKATPANYTDGPDVSTSTGGAVTSNVQIKTATRAFTAASEDPGACGTLSAAPSGWTAWTIAVHAPAPTFAQVANWFVATSPKTITDMAWASGDVIVVAGAAESALNTLATPTNANLTFTLQASQTDGGSGEAPVWIWTAVAGSAQTAQTISVSRSAGSGEFGFGCWVLDGRSGSFANASANRTESAFSVTPSADSVVVYAISDWSANTTDQTPTTATGTPHERVDIGNGSTYGAYLAEWTGVTASNASFGVTSYSGLQIGHAVIEVLAASSPIEVAADSAVLALSGVTPDLAGTGAATTTADVATLNLTGIDPTAGGSGAATITADTATLTFTGVDVTASTGATEVSAEPAILTLTGTDPTFSGSGTTSISADTATLTFSGVDVTASTGGGGPINIDIDPAVITFTGVTPELAGSGAASTTADVAVLVLSGVEVTVSASADITVDTAVLTLTGVDVVATGTGTAAVIADTATLSFAGATPTLAGSGAIGVTVDVAVLVLEGVEVGAFVGQQVTPEYRIFVVSAEPRTYVIEVVPRMLSVPSDLRTFTVPAD